MLRRAEDKKFAPGFIHTVGGKMDPGENPLEAVRREVLEESGIIIKNIKLEAILVEIVPYVDLGQNWMVYYFSADYDSGELVSSKEGELLWLTKEELLNEKLLSSMKLLAKHIINPDDGLLIATLKYDQNQNVIESESKIEFCGL